jgi:CSLREA domain-containing protein
MLAAWLALFCTVASHAAQQSRTFLVNSTADAPDADLADHICATAAKTCTLRAAVQQANAVDGADTITMLGGTYTLSITGADEQAAKGDLDITGDLTISGVPTSTTTIDAAQIDRIFDVYTATVTLDNVIMHNGKTSANGGTIYNRGTLTMSDDYIAGSQTDAHGGGIFNAATGTVTAHNVTFESLRASNGGAIWNAGSMQVTDSSFSDNAAQSSGGAITNDQALTITHSFMKRNHAFSGGAVQQGSGTLVVQTSTFDGNAAVYGGAIAIDGNAAVHVSSSTLSNNAASQGGGIFTLGVLTLLNSTLSGNSASNTLMDQFGGGIFNGGSTTASSVTMVNNTAPNGNTVRSTGTMTFTNSIVAQNENAAGGANCSGTVTSAGYNLDSGDTCAFNATGDRRNANPMLDALGLNSATIQTHALLPGSPAIDSGALSGCPSTDERGVARPQGPRCDMGAFEFVPATTATPTIITPQPGTPTATSQSGTPAPSPLPGTIVPTTATTPLPVLDRTRVLLPLIIR